MDRRMLKTVLVDALLATLGSRALVIGYGSAAEKSEELGDYRSVDGYQ